MKQQLCIVLFGLCALCAPVWSADPVVVVNSATSVTIDGQPAGSVVDALANNPKIANLRALLLDAWIARENAIAAAEKARADDAIAAAQADAKAATDAAALKCAAADKETARVSAIVAALKSVTMGPLPDVVAQAIVDEDTKKKAALEAQRAELDKQITALVK